MQLPGGTVARTNKMRLTRTPLCVRVVTKEPRLSVVEYTTADEFGIAVVTLNRPEAANALNTHALELLTQALEKVNREQPLMTLFRGEGKHFCSGVDLNELRRDDCDVDQFFRDAQEVLLRVNGLESMPVVLAQGAAFGAGADLVMACHLRLGRTDLHIRFPGPQFGVLLGTRRLFGQVGSSNALRLLLSNNEVLAEEAARLGLISTLVKDDSAAMMQVREGARVLAVMSPRGRARLRKLGAATREDGEIQDLEESLEGGAVSRGLHAFIENRS